MRLKYQLQIRGEYAGTTGGWRPAFTDNFDTEEEANEAGNDLVRVIGVARVNDLRVVRVPVEPEMYEVVATEPTLIPGEGYRVGPSERKVGPFTSRARAEDAAARLVDDPCRYASILVQPVSKEG